MAHTGTSWKTLLPLFLFMWAAPAGVFVLAGIEVMVVLTGVRPALLL